MPLFRAFHQYYRYIVRESIRFDQRQVAFQIIIDFDSARFPPLAPLAPLAPRVNPRAPWIQPLKKKKLLLLLLLLLLVTRPLRALRCCQPGVWGRTYTCL